MTFAVGVGLGVLGPVCDSDAVEDSDCVEVGVFVGVVVTLAVGVCVADIVLLGVGVLVPLEDNVTEGV